MFGFPSFRRQGGKKPNPHCPNCGAEISGDWEFCPKCGTNLHGREEGREEEDIFSLMPGGFSLFADMDKQLEEMDRAFFGHRKSLFELPKPTTRKGPQVRGGGISISFSGGTGAQPRVVIHTSGDFKPLEPELRRKFGVPERKERLPIEEEAKRAPPEITEEPEAELVKGAGGKISALKVKLPDVESAKDIKISRLPNSMEIKAYVKNKAYFKLFEVPPAVRVAGTAFKNGVLTISFE